MLGVRLRVWGLRLFDSLLDLPLAVCDAFGGARRRLQWKIQDLADALLDVPAALRSRFERMRHVAPHVARQAAAAAADLPWRVADGGVWVRRRPFRNSMLLAGALALPVAVTFLILSSQPVSRATAAAPAAALRAAPDRPQAAATTEQATASAPAAKLRPTARVRFRKQASPARGRAKAKKTLRLRKSPPAPSTLVSAPVVSAPVVSAPVVSAPVVSAPVVSSPVLSAPVVSAPVSPSATRQAAAPAREREPATNVVIVKTPPRPAPFPRVVIEIQPTVTVAPPKPKVIPPAPPVPPIPEPQP